jgi:hypothetical protein
MGLRAFHEGVERDAALRALFTIAGSTRIEADPNCIERESNISGPRRLSRYETS